MTKAEKETACGILSDEDCAMIDDMAAFHDITRDEAYQFWLEGNYDCLVVAKPEDEDTEEN